jgi:hypothetical protein
VLETMPCSWPVIECGPLPEVEDQQYESLRQSGSEVLWALSGRQFGCCETTRRPCRRSCLEPEWGRWPNAQLIEGQWVNVACRTCGDHCSCSRVCEVRLPGPVCEVIEVTVGGDAVPTGSYRVDDLEWLVRTDGDCWPLCQDMGPDLGEPGTWGVRYTLGTPVPSAGQRALGELMSQLWLACKGDGACVLPTRVRVMARTGAQSFDPMDFIEKGKTGLYFTDLWLQAVNPQARPAGARIASPDWDEGRTTTWP